MIPEKITSIEQRAFLRGYQKLEIRPDGDLEVFFKRFSIQRQFRIPLLQINPKPERHKVLSVGSLVGLIIFGGLSLFTLWGIIECLISPTDKSVAPVLLFPFIFLLILACVCFSKFRQQSINAIIYYLREGGQIHVWFEKPDPKTFNEFCQTLSKEAEAAWNNRSFEPAAQSLAGELTALKKLKDSGILDDAEFEKAKAKLLEQAEEKTIGFGR